MANIVLKHVYRHKHFLGNEKRGYPKTTRNQKLRNRPILTNLIKMSYGNHQNDRPSIPRQNDDGNIGKPKQ